MRIEQCFHRLQSQFLKVFQPPCFSGQPLGEVVAYKQFHDNEESFIVTAHIIDGDDVRMLQVRQSGSFLTQGGGFINGLGRIL